MQYLFSRITAMGAKVYTSGEVGRVRLAGGGVMF